MEGLGQGQGLEFKWFPRNLINFETQDQLDRNRLFWFLVMGSDEDLVSF